MAGAWVVLTAAGSGSRLGANRPKALVRVGNQTILELALERVLQSKGLAGVVITCPAGEETRFEEAVRASVEAMPTSADAPKVSVVPGGASRQGSVLAGLKEVQLAAGGALQDSTPVLVHDAARCLTPPGVFDNLIELIEAGAPAVIPVLPVTDTIVSIDPGVGPAGLVAEALDRSTLAAVQTPQAFQWDVLFDAHERAAERADSEATAATDDATLVRQEGHPVLTTPGSELAFKVTLPADLELARSLLG